MPRKLDYLHVVVFCFFSRKTSKGEFLPNYALLTSDRESHLTEAFRVLENPMHDKKRLQHLFYKKISSSHDITE